MKMGGSSRRWFVLAAIMAVLAGVSRSDIEADKAECMDQLIGLATCLPYVAGDAKAPTLECCSGAKQVVQKSMKCLCILIKDRDDKSLGITVNISKALHLPTSCHATANLTKCIDILHLPLNSTEAKVYEDFAKSILPKNGTGTVPTGNVNVNSTGSGTSSLSSADSGGQREKNWYGPKEMVFIGVSALFFTLPHHIFDA